MSMMYKFDKDFVIRTKELLSEFYDNTEREVTLLLNCLLALVVLPVERKNGENAIKFQEKCVDKMGALKNSIADEIFNEDRHTFNHIRNAIAHLHIELEESNYKNKISNVIFIDANSSSHYKNKDYNFKISISVDNLKKFAIYIADEFIKDFEINY